METGNVLVGAWWVKELTENLKGDFGRWELINNKKVLLVWQTEGQAPKEKRKGRGRIQGQKNKIRQGRSWKDKPIFSWLGFGTLCAVLPPKLL